VRQGWRVDFMDNNCSAAVIRLSLSITSRGAQVGIRGSDGNRQARQNGATALGMSATGPWKQFSSWKGTDQCYDYVEREFHRLSTGAAKLERLGKRENRGAREP